MSRSDADAARNGPEGPAALRSVCLVFLKPGVIGFGGPAVATVGIFLPAFVFVASSGPLVPRLRRSPAAGAVLDGVNAASLSPMIAVTYQLGRAALAGIPASVIALVAVLALVRFRVKSSWLVPGGAAAGTVLHGRRRRSGRVRFSLAAKRSACQNGEVLSGGSSLGWDHEGRHAASGPRMGLN